MPHAFDECVRIGRVTDRLQPSMESRALQFIMKSVPREFHSDTNIFIGGCFICLAWPRIEISDGQTKVVLDCPTNQGMFSRDDTALIPFLRRFPELCARMVDAHPLLRARFRAFDAGSPA
ncbi:MAG: hypothetical protein ACN6QT_28085 [Burkholderia contaminans]|uniref:hypothetical protein n=1 Tax=Burkholderia cepacia complex TaxID=87882 RepID=UPI0012D9BCD0|nr:MULTISPECIES: hypothetical protein [Burkholderia cepacia complex]MBR8010082.1 hypothetical protein [Burkholderia vietnamiensis]MBR8152003.1 hypothetical protein [Burkholderia vietnamiensis]MBR8164940.1 hypothetical protein [Burkholderia vietnamiensis]MBR8193389.1 hypothetical protein [Burkholderia vietnamiensis]MCA8211769.1 hypothetical protein [Burkholderia vietnamiensis]